MSGSEGAGALSARGQLVTCPGSPRPWGVTRAGPRDDGRRSASEKALHGSPRKGLSATKFQRPSRPLSWRATAARHRCARRRRGRRRARSRSPRERPRHGDGERRAFARQRLSEPGSVRSISAANDSPPCGAAAGSPSQAANASGSRCGHILRGETAPAPIVAVPERRLDLRVETERREPSRAPRAPGAVST